MAVPQHNRHKSKAKVHQHRHYCCCPGIHKWQNLAALGLAFWSTTFIENTCEGIFLDLPLQRYFLQMIQKCTKNAKNRDENIPPLQNFCFERWFPKNPRVFFSLSLSKKKRMGTGKIRPNKKFGVGDVFPGSTCFYTPIASGCARYVVCLLQERAFRNS